LIRSHLIKIFIYFFKKIRNKYFFKKKKKKLGVAIAIATPLGTKGWLDHPHEAKGVSETTPNGGLGVVSTTPWAHWGGRATLNTHGGPPQVFFFSFFFLKKYFSFLKKKKKI
jgi:hypothetical protein